MNAEQPQGRRQAAAQATQVTEPARAAKVAHAAPPQAQPGPAAQSAPQKARDPRQRRQQALAQVRRELVLDAARAAFLELGIDKASMRQIAQRAGYTVGAIYSYFPSKEVLYGTLLGESLQRLNAHVRQGVGAATPGAAQLRAAAGAFYDFYRDHPGDLDLGFYLFQGMQPRGLTPQLNQQLNASLQAALAPVQQALQQLGLVPQAALAETTALFAHAVGLLVLNHTGRIRMFRQRADALFTAYVDNLVVRVADGQP